MEHRKMYKIVHEGKEEEISAYIIEIRPMYIGKKSDNRLEDFMFIRRYDPSTNTYDEYQSAVKPKSRLDQEIKKLLDITVKKDGMQKEG